MTTPAANFCSACGTPLAEGARFCASCGTPVGGAVAAGSFPMAWQPTIDLAGTSYALASFWRRVGAALIDAVAWSFVSWPLQVALQVGFVGSVPGSPEDLEDPTMVFDWVAAAFDALLVWGAFYALIVGVVSIAFEAFGWTPGKAALGMRVLRGDGQRPGRVHGMARYTGKLVSGMSFGLGYLWAAWDPQRQTWHDKFASTYVVLVPRGGIRWPAGPARLAISRGAQVWAGIGAVYLVGIVVGALTLATWVTDDGAAWQRLFESLGTPTPSFTPTGPRIANMPPAGVPGPIP